MIKPIDPKEVPARCSGKNDRAIRDFINTGARAGEVELEGKTVNSASACYRTAIKRNNYPVKQVIRDGKLYLLRTD